MRNASPYLGSETAQSMNMFANLRWRLARATTYASLTNSWHVSCLKSWYIAKRGGA